MAERLNIKVSRGYPLNMAKIFRIWFISGFFGLLLWVGLAIPLWQVNLWKIKNKVDQGLLFLLHCCMTVMITIWLLLGGFWRFSNAGRVVSGDLIENLNNVDKEFLK